MPTPRRITPSQVVIESGLTHAELAPTLRPMPEARTLSASLYTSPGVLRLEEEGLFAKMWLCVGREADIPTAGDYFTHQIAGESVIVMCWRLRCRAGLSTTCAGTAARGCWMPRAARA